MTKKIYRLTGPDGQIYDSYEKGILGTLKEPHSYGLTCKAFPTARAALGRPTIRAISP